MLRAVLLDVHLIYNQGVRPGKVLSAYSYVPGDGLKAQQAPAQAVDNTLFFAGEALSVGHIGTVHGADREWTTSRQEGVGGFRVRS